MTFLQTEYLMRNEEPIKPVFTEIIADPDVRMICGRIRVPFQLKDFCLVCLLTRLFCSREKLNYILGSLNKNNEQDTNLLYENRCRLYVLSLSNFRDVTMNYCPNGLMSTSPLSIRPLETHLKQYLRVTTNHQN